jgi:hypothetical protein
LIGALQKLDKELKNVSFPAWNFVYANTKRS